MDEDLAIINTNTRNEKIKNFLILNKKKILVILSSLLFLIVSFFIFKEYKKNQLNKISDFYNTTIIEYSEENKDKTKKSLVYLIKEKDKTYSLLSLNFIIDNDLISDKKEINYLFDIIIDEIKLEKELMNLVIYKKALFNANSADENRMLNILNPLLNSETIWKSEAQYLMAEFFYSKNELQKSKEFFNEILKSDDASIEIKKKSQKRINRDLSE